MSINKYKRSTQPGVRSSGSSDGPAGNIQAGGKDITWVLAMYRELITDGLRGAVQPPSSSRRSPAHATTALVRSTPEAVATLLDEFYGQIEYHMGWRRPDLSHATSPSGKLLRPTLVLLACDLAMAQTELSGASGADDAAGALGTFRASGDEAARLDYLRRIIPAAVAIELVHNFSLIHDDIEDSDEERHHRPTLWKLFGIAQAINAGDGLFALARKSLWQLEEAGIQAELILHLADLLDRTCVELCEGQFLDMRYEGRSDISEAMYLDMIGRKTAALMACATELGACLGAPEDADLQAHFARFGRALGIAFQLRDDLLGIWEAEQLGKTMAGDLRRKKMSLPVIHALQTADSTDRLRLLAMMTSADPLSDDDIGEALAILNRTGARTRISEELAKQGAIARTALREGVLSTGAAPLDTRAYPALEALLEFVLATR
jgi:geranylgeranyl diphosphate synthase, type I